MAYKDEFVTIMCLLITGSIIAVIICPIIIDAHNEVAAWPKGNCDVMNSVQDINIGSISSSVTFREVEFILDGFNSTNLTLILEFPPPPKGLNLKTKSNVDDFVASITGTPSVTCHIDISNVNDIIAYREPIGVGNAIGFLVIAVIVLFIVFALIVWICFDMCRDEYNRSNNSVIVNPPKITTKKGNFNNTFQTTSIAPNK